jgi:hypothetical protein
VKSIKFGGNLKKAKNLMIPKNRHVTLKIKSSALHSGNFMGTTKGLLVFLKFPIGEPPWFSEF